ncbi:MAG: ABC transporter substrate-binding protein [Candidatus Aminicenantes bacterium]|nr:ABC transporter substrate-binding protein [Candidatus Aminicenantes bacterium]
MAQRFKILIISTAILGLCWPALASIFGQKTTEKPRSGGTLRIKAYAPRFNQVFDPASSTTHFFIAEQLYDGLLSLDKDFNITAGLAQRWIEADRQQRHIFFLKPGIRFHHGSEVTADDVKYSLERLVQKRPDNLYYQYFTTRVVGAADYYEGRATEVTGFRVVDKYTFEIRWLRPYVSGLYFLAMYYCKILPRDLVAAQGPGFFDKPQGTGAFKFDYWVRNPRLEIVGVRLKRNDAYFGKKPYLDAVEYSPDFSEEQFREGDVHIMPPQSEGLLSRYPKLENTSLRTAFLGFSCSLPPFDRPDVRRAVALALDRERLTRAAGSIASPTEVVNNFIPATLPGFRPRKELPFDRQQALALLAPVQKAGLSRVVLPVVPELQVPMPVYNELARQLSEIGLRPSIRRLRTIDEVGDLRIPFLILVDWAMDFPDPEDIVSPLFASRAVLNVLTMSYGRMGLDRLLERSEVEPGYEARTRLFSEMEDLLAADLPALPLYTTKVRVVLQPSVRGARAPALGFFFLDVKEIWLER